MRGCSGDLEGAELGGKQPGDAELGGIDPKTGGGALKLHPSSFARRRPSPSWVESVPESGKGQLLPICSKGDPRCWLLLTLQLITLLGKFIARIKGTKQPNKWMATF